MSLKKELQLNASPKNLKEADDMKQGGLVLVFGFFFVWFVWGFLLTTPKDLSMHLQKEGWEGKNQRTPTC